MLVLLHLYSPKIIKPYLNFNTSLFDKINRLFTLPCIVYIKKVVVLLLVLTIFDI